MARYFKVLVILLSIAVFTSCEKEEVDAGQILERYFLSNEGAVIPVEFRGLEASNTAIIFVHGGPGSTGIYARSADGLRGLESFYKVIYYDQRGAGVSQGNPEASSMTLDQYTKDLNVIIDFVEQKADVEKIFLMGQSFGGGLSTYYLSQLQDERINGFIAVSPAFDIPESLKRSRDWALNIINAGLSSNPSNNNLRKRKTFYENNPVINPDNFVDHLKNVEQLGGLRAAKNSQSTPINDYNVIAHEAGVNLLWVVENLSYKGESVLTSMGLQAELPNIKIPTLLLHGASDGLVPPSMADIMAEKIGTPNNQFRQELYPNAGHELFSEKADLLINDVKEFVDKYN